MAYEELIALIEIDAVARFGLVTRAEANQRGLHDRVISRLVRTQRWRRVGQAVYAVEGIEGGPFQSAAAQLLIAGHDARLQRRTAAALHGGLDLPWDGRVDLSRGPGCGGGRQRRLLPSEHIVEIQGLRTTDVLLTLLDLACELSDVHWEWALEAGLRSSSVSVALIEEALGGPGRKDRRGVERVRRVLALRPPCAPATESLLETRFVQLARKVGAPTPTRQHVVCDQNGRFVARVDLAWPQLGLFVELDGEHHLLQPLYDAARETEVVAKRGWLCGRFTWTAVVRNPTPTGRRLLQLVDQAERRPPSAA